MRGQVDKETGTVVKSASAEGILSDPVSTAASRVGAGAVSVRRRPRLITFFDGQNIAKCAKELFGYEIASYDPQLLSEHVAARLGCDLVEVRFYTGMHKPTENMALYNWWTAKLHRMRNRGIVVTQRTLAYTYESVTNKDGTLGRISVPREKGIDLRIGLDMVRLARSRAYDVVVVFSQDNDLGEATDEVKRIAQEQARFIKVASAYPCGVAAKHPKRRRGIDRTDWIKLTRAEYDSCLETVAASGNAAPEQPVTGGGGASTAVSVSTGRTAAQAQARHAVGGLGPTAAAAASTAPNASRQPTDFGAALLAALEDAKKRSGDEQ